MIDKINRRSIESDGWVEVVATESGMSRGLSCNSSENDQTQIV